VTTEQWAVLRVLAGGPVSRDEVASLTGIPEHVVGALLSGLMRDSLVGKVPRSSGRPRYGLTDAGRYRMMRSTNWHGLDPDLDRVTWIRSLVVNEPMTYPPPVPPTKQRKRRRKRRTREAYHWPTQPSVPTPVAPGDDAELRQAVLAALLAGRQTRDRVAAEVSVTEHVAGRVLDRLIWDSLVARRSQDSGRPTYELTAAGRQKLLGVSPQLQKMAQKGERVLTPTAPQPAVKPRARFLSRLWAWVARRVFRRLN
jgi:predicted ArsR family transcriptional regulator